MPATSEGVRVGRFAVITDSTADLSEEIARERGIEVIPLSVNIGQESFSDGVLTQAQFFERMNSSPTLPTTSQPPIGAFIQAYERALEAAEEVVSIHISSRLSGTVDAARQAAESFAGRVHVFDSKNLSFALGFQVLDAAESAARGLSVAAALNRLEQVRERVRLIVGLDSLENLEKGGRIGRVSAFLGAVLDLKVTFTVARDGAFVPVKRSRGEKAALRSTLDWVAEQVGESKRGRFAVGHALSLERAQMLAEQIKQRFDATDVHLYETGTVIATHTGTGWGIAVLPEQ